MTDVVRRRLLQASIAAGVGTLIGGVIVSAAALYFGTLDTSWVRG